MSTEKKESTEEEKRTEVRVRLEVKRLMEIDLVTQRFKAHILLEASWVESAMEGLDLKAHPWVKTEGTMACQREGVLKLKGSEYEYFAPRLTFRNQVETTVEDMWYVLYEVESAPPIVCLRFTEWKTDASASTCGYRYSLLLMDIHVERQVSYWVLNVVMPMAMITGATFMSYFVPPTDFADRCSITLTMMLAQVAYKYLVAPGGREAAQPRLCHAHRPVCAPVLHHRLRDWHIAVPRSHRLLHRAHRRRQQDRGRR